MNKHILVVDDDAHMRSILQEVLENEAYVVETASDGLSALDKLIHQQAMPEVILLDLNLPRINGLQLIEALRQHEEVRLDSIIVLSGDSDALQQASRLGIHRCLAKPLDLETLLVLILRVSFDEIIHQFGAVCINTPGLVGDMRHSQGMFCFSWSYRLVLSLSKLLFVEEAFKLQAVKIDPNHDSATA